MFCGLESSKKPRIRNGGSAGWAGVQQGHAVMNLSLPPPLPRSGISKLRRRRRKRKIGS
jgi:hypothetical protein